MTASEFAFLALGLVLGVASGAALVEVLRSRPPARREVRVTVAPNSIPRRPTTLAEADALAQGPARRGPADRREEDRDMPPPDELAEASGRSPGDGVATPIAESRVIDAPWTTPLTEAADRTPVPSLPRAGPFRLTAAGSGAAAMSLAPPRAAVGIPISREPDPMVTALRATAAASASAAMRRSVRGDATPAGAEAVVAGSARSEAEARAEGEAPTGEGGANGDGSPPSMGDGSPAAATAASSTAAPDDACADQRRVAEERCAVATRAREGAAAALDALRTSQRTYDDHVSRGESEAAAADPRAVRAAKESAQQAFREARSSGRTRDDIEAAARDWLTEINRINQATREATAAAERHRRAANEIAASLERLSVEADAARISAEVAEEACVAPREAVAAGQQAAAIAAAGGPPPAPAVIPPAGTTVPDEAGEPIATPMGSRAGEDAAIIRLLRGDREVLTRIAATLGGDDEEARRHWQVLIGGLLEALIARAIEASAFDFPQEGSFWSPFTRSQARDIAAALSSLGYRHDGFGGWADDRIPAQRDLSLAVGYAGLDPMRIRVWPTETEMPDLLRNVTVAADEYVWDAAGGLTLGELVSLLGRRADGLAELWNEWGAVRPLLLSAE